MLPLTRYFFRTGILLLLPGAWAGWYGLVQMRRFFQELPHLSALTVRYLMRYLIVPHTLFLFGFAAFVFGMLLIIKGTVFHREHPGNGSNVPTR